MFEIFFPRRGFGELAERIVPKCDLRARHAARSDYAAPHFMGTIDAELFPRRYVGKVAMRAHRRREREYAELARLHVLQEARWRRRSDIDMTAEQCGDTVAR